MKPYIINVITATAGTITLLTAIYMSVVKHSGNYIVVPLVYLGISLIALGIGSLLLRKLKTLESK